MNRDVKTARRRALLGGLAAVIGAWFGKASAVELRAGDDVVHTHMRRGDPPTQPLDSMMVFERGDTVPTGGTREILSLIHQEKAKRSYPWTMYASLETHHEEGDACVVCSRLHKYGPGWSTGLHSEVFNHARAVAIGTNIEMSSDYEGPDDSHVIGLNIQAVASKRPMQYGIQIHDGGGHFDTAVALNGAGEHGVDLRGKFAVGINARSNTIRVDECTCIELDGKGQIKLRYQGGRIEFLNGDRCIGHIDVNGPDHAL